MAQKENVSLSAEMKAKLREPSGNVPEKRTWIETYN